MRVLFNAGLLVIAAGLISFGCDSGTLTEADELNAVSASSNATVTSSTELFAFQAAGDVGGGVLIPGTTFPPTEGSKTTIIRHSDWVQFQIHTTNLPPGAYTVWIVTLNNPENCLTAPCSEVDVFGRQDIVDSSVYWATGGIVHDGGIGNFSVRLPKGYAPTEPGTVGLPGSGVQNTMGGEYHLIVKYHGPASDDPDVLYEQTHSLLGSCEEGANALDLGEPFGIQCFDPQAAIHQP